MMLALQIHSDKKPNLAKGALFIPLVRWEDSKIPLRILRDESRVTGHAPDHFVTLVKIPDSQLVAVIVGRAPEQKEGLTFSPLSLLPTEDQDILRSSMEKFRNPNNCELGISWLARLIIGERIDKCAIKWTKDLRLLQQGVKNASTKRI